MDSSTPVIIALLVAAVVVIAFLYRRGAFKAGLKAFGTSLDIEGRGAVDSAAHTGEGDPGKSFKSAATGTETSGAGQGNIGSAGMRRAPL